MQTIRGVETATDWGALISFPVQFRQMQIIMLI